MNYFKQVAEMLGVELEEKFKLKSADDGFKATYKMTKDGLLYNVGVGWNNSSQLIGIISGNLTIVKLPWKPNFMNEYYAYSTYSNAAVRLSWKGITEDLLYWKLGNCFRTREEAEAKGKEIMEAICEEFKEA